MQLLELLGKPEVLEGTSLWRAEGSTLQTVHSFPSTNRAVERIAGGVDDQQCHLLLVGTDPQHSLLVVKPLDALTVHSQDTVPFLHPCLLSRQPRVYVP